MLEEYIPVVVMMIVALVVGYYFALALGVPEILEMERRNKPLKTGEQKLKQSDGKEA